MTNEPADRNGLDETYQSHCSFHVLYCHLEVFFGWPFCFCTDLDKHRRKAKPVRATPKSGEIFCWRKRKTLNIYFGISACRGRSSFFAFCAFSRFARFRELRKCLMNAFAWPGELCFIQSENGECFSWWSIFMLRHRLKNIIVDYDVRCSISVGLVLGLGSQDKPGGGSRTSH